MSENLLTPSDRRFLIKLAHAIIMGESNYRGGALEELRELTKQVNDLEAARPDMLSMTSLNKEKT